MLQSVHLEQLQREIPCDMRVQPSFLRKILHQILLWNEAQICILYAYSINNQFLSEIENSEMLWKLEKLPGNTYETY